MVNVQRERNMHIAGLCRVLCGEDRAERISGEKEALLTDRQLLRAGELWSFGGERAEGSAGVSEGKNTQNRTRFCSDLEPFTGGRRTLELVFNLLGLKSGFIFTLASKPVCSGESRRCPPPLWVL